MKTILDPSFQYTPSFDTDLRRTFEKARHRLSQPRPHVIYLPDRMAHGSGVLQPIDNTSN